MDKKGASFQRCIESIEAKLKTVALPVQMPVFSTEQEFIGIVDLIGMKKLIWNTKASEATLGKDFETGKLEKTDDLYPEAVHWRVKLIEKLANVNEDFAELLLEKYDLKYDRIDDNILLETYLRMTNLKGFGVTPVLCGSSFRNMCVQPLMDAVIKYLPDPEESRNNFDSKYFGKDFKGRHFNSIQE